MSLLHVCAVSDAGCFREENQDAVLINGMIEKDMLELTLPSNGFHFSHYGLICAVADGLGGHLGGETASHLTLRALAGEILNLSKLQDIGQASVHLNAFIARLHESLVQQGISDKELLGMGTTLTGIYLRPSYGLFFHAGDSRLYRWRGDFLMQISRDHSVESLAEPMFGRDSARCKSGTITNCIGGGVAAQCYLDLGEVGLKQGEILLLCSDGLSDMLDIEEIEGLLYRREGLVPAARCLVDAAKTAGGADNISVVLVERL